MKKFTHSGTFFVFPQFLWGALLSLVMMCSPCLSAESPDAKVAALTAAARNGDLDGVKSLLEQGAGVNAEDGEKFTALMYAAGNNQVAAVGYLIGRGANLNHHSSESGSTALHLAAQMGQLDAVKLLVDKGADINATDGLGMTPLIRAASSCKDDVVEFLLKRGARTDITFQVESNKETALSVAERKYKKFVMLDEGRNIDRKNFRKRYERIIELLKAHSRP